MLAISCTFIGICLFILGSSGNGLCVLVFLRQKFRYRIITPYFIILLFADSIYLLFRLIKLFYYSQTLFRLHSYSGEACSNTFFAKAYQHATQAWPQIFIPLVHSETYIRFSLILMSIIAVQRSQFINRSTKLLVLPSTTKEYSKQKWNYIWIITAFLLAYSFEFAGLTVFCSKSNNRRITFDWFVFMAKNMENASMILTNTMVNTSEDFKCVEYGLQIFRSNETSLGSNPICIDEKLVNILAFQFDQHERLIVNLIQKIILFQTKQRISRNEIRRKYHFHECLFPQDPEFFHYHYDFMYNRAFGFNRYTLLLGK